MISVIIPTYNRAKYLQEMLVSIECMVDVNVEIIISDDYSTDETPMVVKELQDKYDNIKYLRNSSNKGCGYSRRKAYNESRGEYIVFADDDDYYTDFSFFRKAQDQLDKNPNLAFCSGNVDRLFMKNMSFVGSKNPYSGFYPGRDYLADAFQNNGKPISTFPTLFRKSILEKADFKNMEMMNDVSIYMRAVLYGDVFLLDDTIGIYRIHDTNISDNLSSGFIIKNLEEKRWVYNKAQELGLNLPQNWLFDNYMLTSRYFFYSNKYNLLDLIALYKWGNKYSLSTYSYLFKYLSLYMKNRLF